MKQRVARHRRVDLALLESVFTGYAELAQQRWLAWIRKNRLEATIPLEFSRVLDLARDFADPVIVTEAFDKTWNRNTGKWTRLP